MGPGGVPVEAGEADVVRATRTLVAARGNAEVTLAVTIEDVSPTVSTLCDTDTEKMAVDASETAPVSETAAKLASGGDDGGTSLGRIRALLSELGRARCAYTIRPMAHERKTMMLAMKGQRKGVGR